MKTTVLLSLCLFVCLSVLHVDVDACVHRCAISPPVLLTFPQKDEILNEVLNPGALNCCWRSPCVGTSRWSITRFLTGCAAHFSGDVRYKQLTWRQDLMAVSLFSLPTPYSMSASQCGLYARWTVGLYVTCGGCMS